MGDHDNQLAFGSQLAKPAKQPVFRGFIQLAERLVQQDQICLFVHGPRNGNPLPLTATDIFTIFRNPGIQTAGQFFYQLIQTGQGNGIPQPFFIIPTLLQRDIDKDRIMKNKRLLLDISNIFPVGLAARSVRQGPIDPHFPRLFPDKSQ